MALPITNLKYNNHVTYSMSIKARKVKNKVKANESFRATLLAHGRHFSKQLSWLDVESDFN